MMIVIVIVDLAELELWLYVTTLSLLCLILNYFWFLIFFRTPPTEDNGLCATVLVVGNCGELYLDVLLGTDSSGSHKQFQGKDIDIDSRNINVGKHFLVES